MTLTNDRDDEHWMRLALQLAGQGQGYVEPNPMVGCVLVKDGQCIASGYHQRYGGPHAEINALDSLSSPSLADGATAYVTLEPCCHYGKTPPCSLALIQANIRRVVVAMRDPHPKVDGGGIGHLTEAGIDVTLGVLKSDAEALAAPYLKRLRTGMPWVIAKWAMTADGRIATVSGESKWISGEESRRHVHQLRSRVDAIIVAMGTVDTDDPMLDARLSNTGFSGDGTAQPPRVAKRVVLCRRRLPSIESKLIQTASQIPTWLFTAPGVDPARLAALQELGAVGYPLETDNKHEMVRRTLLRLAEHDLTNVMIEGGPGLLGSCMDPNAASPLIDECHVYVGAKLFGGVSAPGPIGGEGFATVPSAPMMKLSQLDRFDDDVRMIYRVERR